MSSDSHRTHLKDYLSLHKRLSKLDNEKNSNESVAAIPKTGSKFRHNVTSTKPTKKPVNPPKFRTSIADVQRLQRLTIHNVPDEILLKVFGYLNAGDLVTASQVCHQWHGLANDESLWRSIFKENVKTEKNMQAVRVDATSTNYLKTMYIKSCVKQRDKRFLKVLKKKNPYTGVIPSTDIKKSLIDCGVKWQLTCVDHSDKERCFTSSEVCWHRMSLSVHWNDLDSRQPSQVKIVKIYACVPLFYDTKTGNVIRNSPYQRSLMLSVKIKSELESTSAVGGDDLVNAYALPHGLLVATWKADGYLAFMSAGFHYHQLINRCLRGSPNEPYLLPAPASLTDDVDPQFGMHGYSCTIELRSLKTSLWDQQFRHLDRSVGYCGVASSKADKHSPVYADFLLVEHPDKHLMQKKVLFPWKTLAFSGKMTNVCWVDVTVIDERADVFWAVSNPVFVKTKQGTGTSGVFDESYETVSEIDLADGTGKMYLHLGQAEDKRTYIIGAHLGVSLKAVNSRFGTNYQNRP